MSRNIPPVRTWRATFYGFGTDGLNGPVLGSVTVQAPTKTLARLGFRDALFASDKATQEAWEKCSRWTWGIVPKPRPTRLQRASCGGLSTGPS